LGQSASVAAAENVCYNLARIALNRARGFAVAQRFAHEVDRLMAIVVTALVLASGVHALVHNFDWDSAREHKYATALGLSHFKSCRLSRFKSCRQAVSPKNQYQVQ